MMVGERMRYFIENKLKPRWDALYHTYYVYDDLNDRLYYAADNINRKEILNPKKSEILSNNKDFKKVESIECFKPDFYVRVNRFRVYSREEENAQYVDFLDEKSYKAFLEAMESFGSVKAFVADGAKRLGVEAAKYIIKKSGYESLLFEALKKKADDFVGSYLSPLHKEDEIKLSFAIDVESFVKDRFFLGVGSKFETWLCHTMPEVVDLVEKNGSNDDAVYFAFNTNARDNDGLYHVYYVYDKLKDELYVKVHSTCHKVTGAERAIVFKKKEESWLKLKKEECDKPDAYKSAVSYFIYGKNEDDFLEFYDEKERDRFAKIAASWKSFKAFLVEAINEWGKEWAKELYEKSGSVSLLFSLLRKYEYIQSYLPVDAERPAKEDFLSRSLRVLTGSLSDGDDSWFIADIEKIFNDIFKKNKKAINEVKKGSRVVLASKKTGSKEDRYWKIYTDGNKNELNYDLEMLKSMGYELAEIWC